MREEEEPTTQAAPYLIINRMTPQKHISTASTEKILDNSATDTSIAVIVSRVSLVDSRRPHGSARTRTHTRTHARTTHARRVYRLLLLFLASSSSFAEAAFCLCSP